MVGLRQSLWTMKRPHTLRIICAEINCDGYQRTYSSQTVSRKVMKPLLINQTIESDIVQVRDVPSSSAPVEQGGSRMPR